MAAEKEVTLKLLTKVNESIARMEGQKLSSSLGKAIEGEMTKALAKSVKVFASQMEKALKKSVKSLGAAQRLQDMESKFKLNEDVGRMSGKHSYIDPMVDRYIGARGARRGTFRQRVEQDMAEEQAPFDAISDRMFSQASGVYGPKYKGGSQGSKKSSRGSGALTSAAVKRGGLAAAAGYGIYRFAKSALYSGYSDWSESSPMYMRMTQMGAFGSPDKFLTHAERRALGAKAPPLLDQLLGPELERGTKSFVSTKATRGMSMDLLTQTGKLNRRSLDLMQGMVGGYGVDPGVLGAVPGVIARAGTLGEKESSEKFSRILAGAIATKLEDGRIGEYLQTTATTIEGLASTSGGVNINAISDLMATLSAKNSGGNTYVTPEMAGGFIAGVSGSLGKGSPAVQMQQLMAFQQNISPGYKGELWDVWKYMQKNNMSMPSVEDINAMPDSKLKNNLLEFSPHWGGKKGYAGHVFKNVDDMKDLSGMLASVFKGKILGDAIGGPALQEIQDKMDKELKIDGISPEEEARKKINKLPSTVFGHQAMLRLREGYESERAGSGVVGIGGEIWNAALIGVSKFTTSLGFAAEALDNFRASTPHQGAIPESAQDRVVRSPTVGLPIPMSKGRSWTDGNGNNRIDPGEITNNNPMGR